MKILTLYHNNDYHVIVLNLMAFIQLVKYIHLYLCIIIYSLIISSFIEASDTTYLWIGQAVSPDLLKSLFNVSEIGQIDPEIMQQGIPRLENDMSQKFHRLLSSSSSSRDNNSINDYNPLNIIRQGIDNGFEFGNRLMEDETFSQMSYVDYLCMIHKQIQNEVTSNFYLIMFFMNYK